MTRRYDGEDQYFSMCEKCNGYARAGRRLCDWCTLHDFEYCVDPPCGEANSEAHETEEDCEQETS